MCYIGVMKAINQRELRNNSGEIMQALDRGEVFIIMRRGVPVGELRPFRQRFVSRSVLRAAMIGAPMLDAKRFRQDVDAPIDQSVEPKA